MSDTVGAMERAAKAILPRTSSCACARCLNRAANIAADAVLAFLDLSQPEIEAVTAAAHEARERHPPEELWFDIDETKARLSALRALAQEHTP